MSLPNFTDIISYSNSEISKAIVETEQKLFNLRFKKATRQNFKSHEIKNAKRLIKKKKTLLVRKLKNVESKDQNLINSSD